MVEKISFVEWVAERELAGASKADIAAELQVEIASLYRYLDDSRVPNRSVMQRILALSENRVDVACFFTAAAA